MSDAVKYRPDKFVLRRLTPVSSVLDEFLTSDSDGPVDPGGSVWTVIPSATVSYSSGYTPNDKGTLIIDSESVSVALSFWDEPGTILYPGDRIDILYLGKRICAAIVDTTTINYTIDAEAKRHGATRRVDFSATAVGVYATMMGLEVTWKNLPKEPAITRIRRWLTVLNWTG